MSPIAPPPGPPPGPPPRPPGSHVTSDGVASSSTSSLQYRPNSTKSPPQDEKQKGSSSSTAQNAVHDGASNRRQDNEAGGMMAEIPDDPEEMEKKLSRERISFFQELELDRVLSAFKLNPYDVLECPMEADEKTITKIYRKKSLLIHPDKLKDSRAETAFSLLKQASSHLLDEDRRKVLDEIVISARLLCLKELSIPADVDSSDARLRNLVPSFDERVRKGTKEIMIDDELRRRRAVRIQHAAEGEEQRKREEAAAERKRKAEESEHWEKTRDDRIDNWRAFHKGSKGGDGSSGKKKKTKTGGVPLLG